MERRKRKLGGKKTVVSNVVVAMQANKKAILRLANQRSAKKVHSSEDRVCWSCERVSKQPPKQKVSEGQSGLIPLL